jgi:PilZ domain
VAFAKAGKPAPAANSLVSEGGSGCRKTAGIQQRNLKPHGLNRFEFYGKTAMTPGLSKLGTKKREARKSLRQPSWITLEGGFAARACVVEDLSSTGAKLSVEDKNTLPAKLRLAFTRDARNGRPCEVVWRRGRTVGVKFVR